MGSPSRTWGHKRTVASVADAQRAVELHAQELMDLPYVVGVGVGEHLDQGSGRPEACVKVYLSQPVDLAALPVHQRIPARLELEENTNSEAVTVPTEVEILGPPRLD